MTIVHKPGLFSSLLLAAPVAVATMAALASSFDPDFCRQSIFSSLSKPTSTIPPPTSNIFRHEATEARRCVGTGRTISSAVDVEADDTKTAALGRLDCGGLSRDNHAMVIVGKLVAIRT